MSDRNKTQVKSGSKQYPPAPAGPSLSRFKDRMSHTGKWIMVILLGLIIVGSVAFFAGTPFANVRDTGPASASPDEAVARVDGEPITRGALDNAVSQQKRMMQMFGRPTSIVDEPQSYQQALKELVQHQVELAAAKKAKVDVSDADYQKEFDKQVDSAIQSQEGRFESPAAFDAYLKSQGKTRADLRKTTQNDIYDRADRQGVDLKEELTNYLRVQNFKKQYEEKLTLPRFIRYSQIVISSNPTPKPGATAAPTAAEKSKAEADAKTKADALMKQVQGSADFAALAKSSSTAFSKDKGGDEGWANPTEPQAQDYLKTAATAKIGQVLGPFKSADGYHILKITGETTRLPKDAKPETDGALQQAADDQYQKYLDDLVSKAKVVYLDPVVKGVIAQAKPDAVTALLNYEKALKANTLPPDEKAWVAYAAGQILMSQNQPARAIAYFDQCLKGSPNSAEALMADGDAQNKLGKADLAKQAYKKALQYATGNTMILAQLSGKFNELKDPADAAAAMQGAQQASQRGGMGGMGGGGMFPGMSPGGMPGGGGSPIQITPGPGGGSLGGVPMNGGTIHVGGPPAGAASPAGGASHGGKSPSGSHGSH